MNREKEIKQEIKDLKKYLRENGLRKVSFMNPGLLSEEYRINSLLFKLNVELQRIQNERAS